MAIAVDVNKTIRHVPTCDRSLAPEKQTTFLLGLLSSAEQAVLEATLRLFLVDAVGAAKAVEVRRESFKLRVLKKALRGWENFRDAAGNQVEFKSLQAGGANGRRMATDEMVDLIPGSIRTELVDVVTEAAQLSEDDQKN
jgi:hypothetical protein